MFVFQFTFCVGITGYSTAVVLVVARLMTVTANSSTGNSLEQIIFTFELCQMFFCIGALCLQKSYIVNELFFMAVKRRKSISLVVVLLVYDAVVISLAGQVCCPLLNSSSFGINVHYCLAI